MSRFESGCSCLFGQRLVERAGHHREPSGLGCMQLCVVGMVVLVERVGREDGQCGQGYAGQSDGRLPRRAGRAAVAGVAGRASRQQRLDAERLARLGGGLGAGHRRHESFWFVGARGEEELALSLLCAAGESGAGGAAAGGRAQPAGAAHPTPRPPRPLMCRGTAKRAPPIHYVLTERRQRKLLLLLSSPLPLASPLLSFL
ncbi:hypothetical protein CDAR_107391 [Caerostris darwini]|uniref:Uncharacterized protein n=1 Tax=Caerostris darwini TaxID=1538125 RepID=A0AAV4NBI7_9ARAC|nr:hypothetical protein CDAR_107391 [Caerostris darwini]